MAKVWGSVEKPKITIRDLEMTGYRCIGYYITSDDEIIGAFMSESANPPHYRVIEDTKDLFFTRREDVLEYIDSVGGKKYREGRRNI